MNEKLLKYVEELARTLRFHEHILQDDNLKECHEQSQICKDVLTPVYYEIKGILQSFDTSVRNQE